MAPTKFEPSRNMKFEADTVWGWTKKQYEVAWSYFSDQELVIDAQLSMGEKADSYLAFLLDLQNTWVSTFRFDPGEGPMAIYTPEVPPIKSAALSQVFETLATLYMTA